MLDGIFEEIWKVGIKGVFQGAKRIGLFITNILSPSSSNSTKEEPNKQEGSIIHYLIGFSVYIGAFYLIIKLMA